MQKMPNLDGYGDDDAWRLRLGIPDLKKCYICRISYAPLVIIR